MFYFIILWIPYDVLLDLIFHNLSLVWYFAQILFWRPGGAAPLLFFLCVFVDIAGIRIEVLDAAERLDWLDRWHWRSLDRGSGRPGGTRPNERSCHHPQFMHDLKLAASIFDTRGSKLFWNACRFKRSSAPQNCLWCTACATSSACGARNARQLFRRRAQKLATAEDSRMIQ